MNHLKCRRIVYRLLFALHAFIGIGAIVGGLAAILNPLEPLGVPAEILKNSPFSNFFIPGLILFTVIGLGNVICAIMLYFTSSVQGYISTIVSGALVIWIVVQCIMLGEIHALHVIFFSLGFIQGVLSIFILFEQRLYPTNLVCSLYKKISGGI